MKWLALLSLLSLLSLPAVASAKGRGVEVRLTTDRLRETKPGQILIAAFLVKNDLSQSALFEEKVILPEGWQIIGPRPDSFFLSDKGEEVSLIAFLVPSDAKAGRYEVTYQVRRREHYESADEETFEVVVLPVVKVIFFLIQTPQRAIAGESFSLSLMLVNSGNSPVQLTLKVKGVPDYPTKVTPAEVNLAVGDRQEVTVTMKTDPKITRGATCLLWVEARNPQGEKVAVQLVSVEILPRAMVAPDLYERLPAYWRLSGGLSEDGRVEFQNKFSGAGYLDPEKKEHFEFYASLPDVPGINSSGKRDEYRFAYRNQNLALFLGDQHYRLSRLTEWYRYGRGAGVDFRSGWLKMGGFYLTDRWEEPAERATAGYLGCQLGEKVGLQINFLEKEQGNNKSQLISWEANLKPLPGSELEWEHAFNHRGSGDDQNNQAYRLAYKGEISDVVYYAFERIYAEPNYDGYYRDVDYKSATTTFKLTRNLRGFLSYYGWQNNLGLDPSQTDARNEERHAAGLTYSGPKNLQISLSYEDARWQDYLLPSDYNYQEKFLRLGLSRSYGWGSLQAYLESGYQEDRLLSKTSSVLTRYSLYSYFRPRPNQSYALYFHTQPSGSTGNPESTSDIGASLRWYLNRNLRWELSWQKNGFGSRWNDITQITSDLSYTFPRIPSLSLRVRYWADSKGSDSWSAFCAYTIPLGIPIRKKKNVGIIKGRIYDTQKPDKPGIARAIIFAGEAAAVSNKNGFFVLPALPTGVYNLWVETHSIGIKRTTLEPLPLKVEVKPGKASVVEIGVVDSAQIFGRVFCYPVNGNNFKNGFIENPLNNGSIETPLNNKPHEQPLSNILVELANGKDVQRRLTDSQGRFVFDDLRPNHYTVKVCVESLPAYHYLDPAEKEVIIQLKAGEEKEVLVKVMLRQRKIEIIDHGEIETIFR